MPVRLPVRMLSRTSMLVMDRPWTAMPTVFNPGLFQSVVLFPSRVMVNPAMVTLFAVTCIVAPGPPIGPRTLVVADAGADDNDVRLVDVDIFVIGAGRDVDRSRSRDAIDAALDGGEGIAAEDRSGPPASGSAAVRRSDPVIVHVDDVKWPARESALESVSASAQSLRLRLPLGWP